MWKVALFLLAVFLLGHLVVRYIRKSPLDPVIEGNQVVVESQDDEVRFSRNGAVSGSYFIVDAKSEDWTDRPVNLRLHVLDVQSAADYQRSYPDFHLYRSESVNRLSGVAMSLQLVAANRETYGVLRGLFDDHESRMSNGGERLCLNVSGEALSLASAESLDDHTDRTPFVARLTGDDPIVFVESADVADCADRFAGQKP
jgi:hypothetical protein